jgi:lipopolysaccharide export system permease protein
MKLLDRVMIVSYVKAYVICLVSLLSLYVVIDLFTNLDDFAQESHNVLVVLQAAGSYYGYRITQIFDRMCEAIVLMAATFTVAWMQRNNELLPLLSAGVPTRRVVRPVLVGTVLMLVLGVANQEMLMPRIAGELLKDRSDPQNKRSVQVTPAYDANGVHFDGVLAQRDVRVIKGLFCTIPDNLANGLVHLTAREARYLPPVEGDPVSGGFLLADTTSTSVEGQPSIPGLLEKLDTGRYFLRTKEVDFDTLTRDRNWSVFASTWQLRELLSKTEGRRLNAVAVQFHMRLTRPILGFLLVYLGLAVILRDQNRHVFISAGLCLVMCAVFFAAVFACKQLGDNDYVSPALAAWLPVLGFGPVAVTMYDAIHT